MSCNLDSAVGCIAASRSRSFAAVAGRMDWPVRSNHSRCTAVAAAGRRKGSDCTAIGRSLGCHRSIISLQNKRVLSFNLQTYRRSLGYSTLPFWVRVCSYLDVLLI